MLDKETPLNRPCAEHQKNVKRVNLYQIKSTVTRFIGQALQHTIRNKAVQTLLSWCFLNKYISPRAVMTIVTFFNIVTIATLMYFKLHIIQVMISKNNLGKRDRE